MAPGFACGVKDVDRGAPHLRMNNVSVDGVADFTLVRRVPVAVAKEKKRWLEPGDVLFCNTNSTELVGKSCVFTGWQEPCTFSNHLTRIRVNRGTLLPGWLSVCLRRLWLEGYFATNCTEFIGQSAFNRDKLETTQIPLPPLPEQRRIVDRVEELTKRAMKMRGLVGSRNEDLDLSLRASFSERAQDAPEVPLSQVAKQVRRKIVTESNELYEEMGVRSFGRGTFKKPALTGAQIGGKRIFRIAKGDLVFNNVFAWEGAIAVAQAEDVGRVGSHRFITYVPRPGVATSEFLCHYFLSEKGMEHIRAASPGSAGRNRTLSLEKLAMIPVPGVGYSDQKRFSEVAERRRQITRLSAELGQHVKSFTASLLSKAFRGEL